MVKSYNGRGTAERWIKEGKNAVKWTRLSCHDFVDNQVRLSRCTSGSGLREKLIKIGAKVVTHTRYVVFQIAEAALGIMPARGRPDTRSAEQEECLLMSRSVVESSGSPTIPARRDRPNAMWEIPVHGRMKMMIDERLPHTPHVPRRWRAALPAIGCLLAAAVVTTPVVGLAGDKPSMMRPPVGRRRARPRPKAPATPPPAHNPMSRPKSTTGVPVKKDENFRRLLDSLEVVSAGHNVGGMARIALDGWVLLRGGKRGIALLAIDKDKVSHPVRFDTCGDPAAADRLADAIAKLPRGSMVVLAVSNEATKRFNKRAQQAILSIGGKVGLLGQPWRCSYYCIGRKGFKPGQAIEQIGREKLFFPPKPVPISQIPFDRQAVVAYRGNLDVDTLHDRVRAFCNRNYYYYDVPDELRGYRFIRTAMAGHRSYRITVHRSGYVFVTTVADLANDIRRAAIESLRQNNWVPTELMFRFKGVARQPVQVWMKKVEAGIHRIPGPDVSLSGGTVLAPSFSAAAPVEAEPVYLPFRPQEPLARVVYDGPLKIAEFNEGVLAFSNRKYKFLNVPFDLRGLQFIRHAGGAHKGYPLTVVKDGVLLVATQAVGVVNNPLSAKGWKPTGMTFYYNDAGGSRLRVWTKQVKKGTEDIPDLPGFIGAIAIGPGFSAVGCVSKDQPEASMSPVYERFEHVQVEATQNRENPLMTSVKLQKGQCFVLEPYPQDKWTGGGSKSGVYCDYMGYADRGHNWMRLRYQIGGGTPVPVVRGLKYRAESGGVLKLFCTDGKMDDNKGGIRVVIKIATDRLESLVGKPDAQTCAGKVAPIEPSAFVGGNRRSASIAVHVIGGELAGR